VLCSGSIIIFLKCNKNIKNIENILNVLNLAAKPDQPDPRAMDLAAMSNSNSLGSSGHAKLK
jgi:hypothetical protein